MCEISISATKGEFLPYLSVKLHMVKLHILYLGKSLVVAIMQYRPTKLSDEISLT